MNYRCQVVVDQCRHRRVVDVDAVPSHHHSDVVYESSYHRSYRSTLLEVAAAVPAENDDDAHCTSSSRPPRRPSDSATVPEPTKDNFLDSVATDRSVHRAGPVRALRSLPGLADDAGRPGRP